MNPNNIHRCQRRLNDITSTISAHAAKLSPRQPSGHLTDNNHQFVSYSCSGVVRGVFMHNLDLNDWLALLVQIAVCAQVSIVSPIVLIDLPSNSFISKLGRATVILGWLIIASKLLIKYPEPLSTGLGLFAALMITAHTIKCLMVAKATPKNQALPPSNYLEVFIFGLLYKQRG